MEIRQTHPPPSSYLGWSIFNTFCCCLPLGIAAIIYSSKVESANGRGDIDRAQDASQTAKMLNIAGLICGIIIIIIYVSIKLTEPKWRFWYFPEGALQSQPFYALCFRFSAFTIWTDVFMCGVYVTNKKQNNSLLSWCKPKIRTNEKPQLSFDFHVHKLDFLDLLLNLLRFFFSSNLLKKAEEEKNKYLTPQKFGVIKHNMNFLLFYCWYCYCWSHCIYRLQFYFWRFVFLFVQPLQMAL